MDKLRKDMNELDEMILYQQDMIDDIYELSTSKLEKHDNEFMKGGKPFSKFLNQRHPDPLRYLFIEDSKNKKWIIYDSATQKAKIHNFGYSTVALLNALIAYDPNSPYYEQARAQQNYNVIEQIVTDPNVKNELEELFDAIINLDVYEKKHTESEFCRYSYALWYKYRFCVIPNMWKDSVQERNQTAQDYQRRIELTGENIEDLINESEDAIKEIENSMFNVFSKYFFRFHDYISVSLGDGSIICGNAYAATEECYSFPLDLLHVLKGDTQTPRRCPRCGQLFFNNNNKAKYCYECRAHNNVIRQENRKNNPCRYLHKQITDIINNYLDCGSEEFLTESNYYWSIIQKKTPKKIPKKYNPHITTEVDYLKWLQAYKESVLKEKDY